MSIGLIEYSALGEMSTKFPGLVLKSFSEKGILVNLY